MPLKMSRQLESLIFWTRKEITDEDVPMCFLRQSKAPHYANDPYEHKQWVLFLAICFLSEAERFFFDGGWKMSLYIFP